MRRQQPSNVVPEDYALSLRRTKTQSRFDMPYPPDHVSSGRKWDSDMRPSSGVNVSILEDYMLEEEGISQSRKGTHGEQEEARNQWRAVTEERPKSATVKQSLDPPMPSNANDASQQNWQHTQSNNMEHIPPSTYNEYSQAPSTYNQADYYPYDYQQYAGYHSYYQGYSDYGQGWGEAQPQQPPPPGLILPDMTQPPPIKPPPSHGVPESAPEPVPVPVPSARDSSPRVKSPSPKQSKSRRHREDVQKSEEPAEIFGDEENQETGLSNQRESYVRKSIKLKKELEVLRQSQEVMARDDSNSHLLQENTKLQLEIQRKLKAIDNVVSMLDSILFSKEEKCEKKKRGKSHSGSKSGRRSSSSSSHDDKDARKSSTKIDATEEKQPCLEEYNLTFFDPEEHWCSDCDLFPATAKEFLNHLHSTEHKQNKDPTDIPWHVNNIEKDRPYCKGAPTKRLPIRGLQFFVACQGWYCKLCSAWIGDLHCASMHLKSQKHMDNFEEFTSKNPDWEQNWSAQRKESMQRAMQEEHTTEEQQIVLRRLLEKEQELKSSQQFEGPAKGRASWGTKTAVSAPVVREIIKVTVNNDEGHREQSGHDSDDQEDSTRSIRVHMRNKAPPPDSKTPMGPALPAEILKNKKSNQWESTHTTSSTQENNGSSKGQWIGKSPAVISETEKELVKNLKEKLKKKYDSDDYQSKKEERKERKRDYRMRERSYDSRDRSRSRGRSRGRSRSREYGRDRDHSRSRSRERRRRRRSSSSRRGRSRSRSGDRRSRKPVTRQWVAPPSSPPPYITRKNEDKDKWDKPKKKATPNPAASLPKSKLPFIGRMPLLKHIAKKKQPEDGDKSEETSELTLAAERRAPEDMDIDSGASDSEQATDNMQHPDSKRVDEENAEDTQKTASGIPLPQDFQDALSILFPDDMGYQQPVEMQQLPTAAPIPPVAPEVPVECESPPPPLPPQRPPPPKPNCNISSEELLMLGIDPEDMVAQERACIFFRTRVDQSTLLFKKMNVLQHRNVKEHV